MSVELRFWPTRPANLPELADDCEKVVCQLRWTSGVVEERMGGNWELTYSSPLGAAGCLADYAFGSAVVGRHDDSGGFSCFDVDGWMLD